MQTKVDPNRTQVEPVELTVAMVVEILEQCPTDVPR